MLPTIFKGNYVFTDPVSDKKYGDIKKSFKTALIKSGINDFRFHDLRHTFASHLVMVGVDLTTVDIPGHVGHSFRRIPATHSDLNRPLIPEQSGHFERAYPRLKKA